MDVNISINCFVSCATNKDDDDVWGILSSRSIDDVHDKDVGTCEEHSP